MSVEAELLKHRPFLVILALLAVGIGGNVAWQAYQDHQRDKAWESVLEGIDCSACSARKASVADKVRKKREAKSLLESLEAEPPVDLSNHVDNTDNSAAE